MKPMRLLLDTNVVIDLLSRRQPFFEDAAKLRVAAAFGDVELWACALSLSDVEYILRKVVPLRRLRQIMGEFAGSCRVVGVTGSDAVDALGTDWPDLEDFCIARAAERVRADYIVTRDRRGFAQAKVSAIDCQELLAKMEREGLSYDEVDLSKLGG